MPADGTVVLRDLADLDPGEQRALFRWLDIQGGRVQVVSVAPTPIFPRVADGEFSEALFYRLNMVTMHAADQVGDPPAHSLVRRRSDSSAAAARPEQIPARFGPAAPGAALAVGPIPGPFNVTAPCLHGSAIHASVSSTPAASAVPRSRAGSRPRTAAPPSTSSRRRFASASSAASGRPAAACGAR